MVKRGRKANHAFEVAREEWGLPIKTNPLQKLNFKRVDKRRERRLRPGEQERLRDAIGATRNQLIAPIIVCALATAMRRGEMLAMRWVDLDLSRQTLLIPETKNGSSRVIPLGREAIAILNRTPRTKDRVFPISANALRLSWVRLTRRAKLKDLHFHDLRQEAISRFFELGLKRASLNAGPAGDGRFARMSALWIPGLTVRGFALTM
jgi:integrase